MLAAGLTVAVGLAAAGPAGDALPWIPLLVVWTATYAGGFAILPWAIAVVFAEGFRLRSVWLWLAVGGGTGAAGYLLNDLAVGTPWDGFDIAFHLAAGFVAGLVYWLVAGRNAGVSAG
jgi:hypothetical protein